MNDNKEAYTIVDILDGGNCEAWQCKLLSYANKEDALTAFTRTLQSRGDVSPEGGYLALFDKLLETGDGYLSFFGSDEDVYFVRKGPVDGNASATREALEELLDAMYGMGIDEETVSIAAESANCHMQSAGLLSVIKKAKAALAATPRQCDVFSDAEAARQAWLSDKDNWDEFGSPRLDLYEWLYAPAKRKKEGGDDASQQTT